MDCICCGKNLMNLELTKNQPMGGTEFISKGHFGSGVFDPMDNSYMIINVCDSCLKEGIKNGRTKVIQ